mmetsp:Transcript_115437/g.358640  ORF Transcript_115437/g.358640 Transcript_115437/m.358640 type:complete len:363 (+) Transcript_115437:206-1294(+)
MPASSRSFSSWAAGACGVGASEGAGAGAGATAACAGAAPLGRGPSGCAPSEPPASAAASLRRFATRSRRPPYFSSRGTASSQFSKPISPSSLSCAAYFFAAMAASGGRMPSATRRSKTPTSSCPRTSASSGSLRAVAVGVPLSPASRRSRASCARSSASDHALPAPGAASAGTALCTPPFASCCSGASSAASPVGGAAASSWRCCRKRASCLAKPRLLSCCSASAGPSSRQCPGHFCTTRNASGRTCVLGSDSIQSSTCLRLAARTKRRMRRPPSGSRSISCTTSGPASGSGPSSSAFCCARCNRRRSCSSASRLAASSRALRSSSARISASVRSLGITSTVRSVSSSAMWGSGSKFRTTSS